MKLQKNSNLMVFTLEKDKTCREAKEEFGKNFIVGVSCYNSFSSYNSALNQSADYVAFGSVYKSSTKKKKQLIQKI